MPKRRVKDAPFSVHLAPGHREIMVRTMNTGIVAVIELGWIEAKKHIYLVTRPGFGLIDLVILNKCFRKMPNRREVRIFIDYGSIERHPGMLIKPSADHL